MHLSLALLLLNHLLQHLALFLKVLDALFFLLLFGLRLHECIKLARLRLLSQGVETRVEGNSGSANTRIRRVSLVADLDLTVAFAFHFAHFQVTRAFEQSLLHAFSRHTADLGAAII